MAAAGAQAKLGDPIAVDWALGHAAVNSRFAEADLASILAHHARTVAGDRHQAGESRSLTQGTSAWAALHAPAPAAPHDPPVGDLSIDFGHDRGEDQGEQVTR